MAWFAETTNNPLARQIDENIETKYTKYTTEICIIVLIFRKP